MHNTDRASPFYDEENRKTNQFYIWLGAEKWKLKGQYRNIDANPENPEENYRIWAHKSEFKKMLIDYSIEQLKHSFGDEEEKWFTEHVNSHILYIDMCTQAANDYEIKFAKPFYIESTKEDCIDHSRWVL